MILLLSYKKIHSIFLKLNRLTIYFQVIHNIEPHFEVHQPTFLLSLFRQSLPTPTVTMIQNPADGKYRTLSAITKPTRKNRLVAGRNGMIRKAKAIVMFLKENKHVSKRKRK